MHRFLERIPGNSGLFALISMKIDEVRFISVARIDSLYTPLFVGGQKA